MLYENIKKLVQYGVETGLTPACEKNYTINLLLDVFKEDEYVEPEEEYRDIDLEEVLNALLDEAVKRNLIEDSIVYRDPAAWTAAAVFLWVSYERVIRKAEREKRAEDPPAAF